MNFQVFDPKDNLKKQDRHTADILKQQSRNFLLKLEALKKKLHL